MILPKKLASGAMHVPPSSRRVSLRSFWSGSTLSSYLERLVS
jgi:hypothetical protein